MLLELPTDASSKMAKNQFDFEDLSIKARALYSTEQEQQSFTMLIKMKRDSAIWVSVSGLGFEVVRILVDTDSIRMLNKFAKSYTALGVEQLKSIIGYDVDLYQLQAILIGNSPFPATKYSLVNGEGNTLIARDAFIQNALRLNESFRIGEAELTQTGSTDSLHIQYNEFQTLKKEGCFPGKVDADYGSGKTKLSIQYNSVSTSKIDNLPFKVPSNYKRGL